MAAWPLAQQSVVAVFLMSLRCFLLWCCSSLQYPNLLPEPPRPLPYLENLTAVLSSIGTSLPSVLTSPSGTKMTISPGSSALIGKFYYYFFFRLKKAFYITGLDYLCSLLAVWPWSPLAVIIIANLFQNSESLCLKFI